ncbi:flagellar biosynthetic protein FliR [Pseudooceanicola sp. CBS1P-1]|uniref:Type III secretion protein n=1 Tax=Pseudooceanicola albus TaxID=2692189 RepID=A0A6L7G7U6_9RHOB|nr:MULTISPECIES: flagellar biosynthetic protein FliR [Pseudooceanicola]MBT9385864.1 flagellar biosynthetic protein FliR [Pseudooceanicola endophyticus]MXN20095.1 type III secretion protein [Pseudooceanicola albus]
MTEALARLMSLAQDQLWQGALIFLRVAAFTSLLPGFGEQAVPVRVKLVIALCLSAVVVSAAPEIRIPPGPDWPTFLRFLGTETVAGLGLGLGLRTFMMGLQTAASMMAQSTSLSQILGNAGTEPMPAIGHILMIGALALAMLMGLHVHAVLYLLISYQAMPAGSWPAGADLSDWGLRLIAQSFRMAYTLAAPFLIVSLIYNLTLGVINRAMPQLMVAFVGAPLITFGGLALLWVLAPQILTLWAEAVFGFLRNPF